MTVLVWAQPATAAVTFVPISGAGSTWAQNAVDQWRRDVTQFGIQVNYSATGSADGRNQFRNVTVDFAVSDVPYGLTERLWARSRCGQGDSQLSLSCLLSAAKASPGLHNRSA